MDAETERALIASCQKGDKTAYGPLVRAHSGRIFALCLSMLGDRHDAEDMTQQTLLRGFMQVASLRHSQRFGTWIAQIARHACIDAIRRRKSQTVRPVANGSEGEAGVRNYRLLEAALGKLDAKYRTALLLFYFDGRNTRSIGETLGISQAAVQTRLSRGRQMLRGLLAAEDRGHE